jgi:hypothetical protein
VTWKSFDWVVDTSGCALVDQEGEKHENHPEENPQMPLSVPSTSLDPGCLPAHGTEEGHKGTVQVAWRPYEENNLSKSSYRMSVCDVAAKRLRNKGREIREHPEKAPV